MENIEAILKHLGLTVYEARALVVLVKNRKCTAERISNLGDIPLPRVYDTMEELAKRGLVVISKSRPQTFQAIDPKRFFDVLKEDEKKRFGESIKTIDIASKEFMKSMSTITRQPEVEEIEESIAYVKRRINVGHFWKRLESEVKKEFLVFAGDLSWVGPQSNVIKKLIHNGIDYKVLSAKPDRSLSANIKKATKTGVDLRFNKTVGGLRAIVVDGRSVYVIQKTSRGGMSIEEGKHWSEEIADYTGIVINSKVVAEVFRDYFNILWERGLLPAKVLKS